MLFRATDVSDAASQEEGARQKDFFTLMYVVQQRFYSPTNVEWRLMEHCLDEINFKYADFSFLVAFTSALALCSRRGRSFFSAYRIPLYVGLVGYDCGLRMTNPCPSITFWNSVMLLDSPLGETARTLHAQRCIYEVSQSSQYHSKTNLGYFSWLWETGSFVAGSLFLQSFLQSVFDQSCWREPKGDALITRIAIHGRFFKWVIFDSCTRRVDLETRYEVKIGFPRFIASRGMRRSYRNEDLILKQTSLGGQLWYRVHFTLMRALGLQGGNKR